MVLTTVPLITALPSKTKSGQRADIRKGKTAKEQINAFPEEIIFPLNSEMPLLDCISCSYKKIASPYILLKLF